VRQQPRHALQKARIVIDHDHDCRLRCHIRIQHRCGNVPGVLATLDLDQRSPVRSERSAKPPRQVAPVDDLFARRARCRPLALLDLARCPTLVRFAHQSGNDMEATILPVFDGRPHPDIRPLGCLS
jgi:hypothetical protein